MRRYKARIESAARKLVTRLRRAGYAVIVVLSAAALSRNAVAAPACEGRYSATPLQPLPTRVVVGLDVRDASPEHQRLAERFLAGIQSAGRKTGPQPTVVLHLTVS